MNLIDACIIKDTKKALDLIMNIKQRIIKDDVLLMPLIFELYKVQLKMNNNTCLDIVDCVGRTALIYACRNKMKEVALELIKTGHANPEQVNKDGQTALILACQNQMTEVALELIKTGYANPEQVDYGNTALILACKNKMTEVALELIKTGKSNPDNIAKDGNTAFSWICENNMKDVAYELVLIGTFTINDILFLKPKWVPEELLIVNPVDVTEVNI